MIDKATEHFKICWPTKYWGLGGIYFGNSMHLERIDSSNCIIIFSASFHLEQVMFSVSSHFTVLALQLTLSNAFLWALSNM